MPDPPAVNLLTRHVLENPWPLGGILLVAALIVGWIGLREGQAGRLRVAGGLAVAGLIVLAVGHLVVTPGEHGRRATRAFVEAVTAADLVGAMDQFADGATLAVGSPSNPGFDLDFLRAQLSYVSGRYTISSNRITMLRGFKAGGDRAIVHLACWTEVDGGYGPTRTSWYLEVARQPDDAWRITRLVWIMVNGQEPSTSLFR